MRHAADGAQADDLPPVVRPATSNRTSRALLRGGGGGGGRGYYPAVFVGRQFVAGPGSGLASLMTWSTLHRYLLRWFGCVVVSSHLRPGIGGMGMGMVRLPACLAGVRWFDADNAVARLMRGL